MFIVFCILQGFVNAQTLYHQPAQNTTIKTPIYEDYELVLQINDTVVSLDLYLIVNNTYTQKRNFDHFTSEEKQQNYDGCFAKQKRFIPAIQLQLKAEIRETFSDFIYLDHQKKGYIATEEFDLIEFIVVGDEKIVRTQQTRKFSSYLNSSLPERSPVYLVEYGEDVYIITSYGSLYFNGKRSIASRSFDFLMSNISQCNEIKTVQYDNNLLSIACGNQGAFVYDFEKGLTLVKTINEKTLKISQVNIQSVRTYESVFFVLDFEKGLFLISDYYSVDSQLMLINISQAFAFDYYDSTIIVIAKSSTKQNYGMELFIESGYKTARINKYFYQEISLYNAELYKDFAILIGYDAHKIVMHSINTSLIINEVESYFEMPALLRVKEVSLKKDDYLFAAISPFEFAFINILMKPASIICHASNIIQQQYKVFLNESNCYEKMRNLDNSKSSGCHMNYTMNYQVLDTRSLFDKYLYLIFSLLFLLLVAIMYVFYRCYRKWGFDLLYLLRKKDKLIEQKKLDQTIQELTYTSSS